MLLSLLPFVLLATEAAGDLLGGARSAIAAALIIPPAILGATVLNRQSRAFRDDLIEQSVCTRCFYDLTGNESGVCPECGTPADASALACPKTPTWFLGVVCVLCASGILGPIVLWPASYQWGGFAQCRLVILAGMVVDASVFALALGAYLREDRRGMVTMQVTVLSLLLAVSAFGALMGARGYFALQ